MSMVSEDQIKRAKEPDLLSYLMSCEPDELVKDAKGQYCTATHDSLKIRGGMWYWNSRGVGGRSALDYLIKVRGMRFTDAVEHLCGKHISRIDSPPRPKVEPKQPDCEKGPFVLPKAMDMPVEVNSYLLRRGIDADIIAACFDAGTLLESKKYHNCIFVGKDANGTARYAALRGTFSNFHGEVDGSDKNYGFTYHSPDTNMEQLTRVVVSESPIDALSCVCLERTDCPANQHKTLYLSLGGTSPKALVRVLEDYPQIDFVVLRLDKDVAGRKGAAAICTMLKDMGHHCLDEPYSGGKDPNQVLQIRKGLQKTPPAKAKGVRMER